MKAKNFSKKLVLNKKTVADLSMKEIKDVYGGAPQLTPYPHCCTWGSSKAYYCCTDQVD
ncbi:MAG: hypothetical protein GY940_02135 [bacterium]|nr:hypothetical protein [bacterium]